MIDGEGVGSGSYDVMVVGYLLVESVLLSVLSWLFIYCWKVLLVGCVLVMLMVGMLLLCVIFSMCLVIGFLVWLL